MRNEAALWFWLIFGLVGSVFPHVLARDWLDEPSVVRWIAVPMLIASAFLLADHYFQISKGLI